MAKRSKAKAKAKAALVAVGMATGTLFGATSTARASSHPYGS